MIDLREEPLDDLYELYELIEFWDDESCARTYGFTLTVFRQILQEREILEKSSSYKSSHKSSS